MTNQYSDAPEPLETAEEYADRLESYIGSDDPLAIQAQTPGIISSLIEGRTGTEVSRQPGPAKWCARAIMAHLADDGGVSQTGSTLVWYGEADA